MGGCGCILTMLLKWSISKKQTDLERAICLFLFLSFILFFDLISMSEMRGTVWPVAVLLVDVVLLCRMHNSIGKAIVLIVVLYLILISIERTLRFGLFDLVGERMRGLDGCLSLTQEELNATPCRVGGTYAASVALLYLGVFVVDYLCTRTFALGMYKEQQKLQSSITLAESVVSDLVRFDLDEAGQRIDMESITPLTETLSQLLRNLHQYRPYLPDSLFAEEVRYSDQALPPSGPSAAILFTDIKSSTAMWEAAPDAMKKALKTHNNIIRSCVLAFRGYEVKTIGDSFMVAFEALADGCAFAMEVQERLAEATWPSDLKLPPSMESQGWKGITIRIGLHYGEVETEVGEVSGRTDYFGRTVNRAARLESVCSPGGVAIDCSLLDQVELSEGWHATRISKTLKGIDEQPVSIAILVKRIFLDSISDMSSVTDSIVRCSSNKVALELVQKKGATTCTVRLECQIEEEGFELRINNALGKAILCTEMSEGSIVTLLSSSITIGWNTARVSSSHVENGLRFVSLMHANFSSSSEVFIGLSSSAVHCGRVGTRDQRFVTVFGSCVNLCGLLSQASYDIGAFALTTTTEQSPRYPFQRPIDCWNDRLEGPLLVCELHAGKLKDWLFSSVKKDSSDTRVSWEWSDDYWDAFHRRDWEAIESNTDKNEDLVLTEVVEMLRKGKSLRPQRIIEHIRAGENVSIIRPKQEDE